MSLYLIVLLLVIVGPLALSFEKNLMLYKRWKYIVPAILITMLFFGTWDIIFTHIGCWQFNPMHNSGIYFFKLPLEEYLFFIAIPYACTFTYFAIKFHFPRYKVNLQATKIISAILIIGSLTVAFTNVGRTYTFVNFIVLPVILVAAYRYTRDVLQYYLAIFPVLAIPFCLVNGILTGSGIEQEVFSYNFDAISEIYLLTMPLEDLFYAFSLILTVIGIGEFLEKRGKKTIAK
ncbi:MAG: lycopene cyclase domain-containing protein [Flavobacteriales bacterium]|jgi:lycopene cyclase domain-containing protein